MPRGKTIQIKKTIIWSFINWRPHPSLTAQEQKISAIIPLISHIFPGINYFSSSGCKEVGKDLVRPVLGKLFPEMKGMPANRVPRTAKVGLPQFLPTKGYEWQDSKKWRAKFEKLLASA